MVYKLFASRFEYVSDDFYTEIVRDNKLRSVGLEPYGPVRTVEAETLDEAIKIFHESYTDDFVAIGCYEKKYVVEYK